MTAALVVMAIGDGEVWVLGAAGGQRRGGRGTMDTSKAAMLETHLDGEPRSGDELRLDMECRAGVGAMLEDVVVCDSIVSVWCEGSNKAQVKAQKKRAVLEGDRNSWRLPTLATLGWAGLGWLSQCHWRAGSCAGRPDPLRAITTAC